MGPDGVARLFRPDLNMERMVRSAERVALPVSVNLAKGQRKSIHPSLRLPLFPPTQEFDADALLILIKKLVEIDKRWIPAQSGYSLYIRPTLIGTRPCMSRLYRAFLV